MSEESGTELVAYRANLMESLFFVEKEAEALREYREKVDAKERKEELRQVASFDDETLDAMVEAGLDKHTIMAAKLIPLIAVAWSDDVMADNEATAILRAARAKGVEDGSDSHRLLEGWLRVQPQDELFETWKGFISGYAASYDVSDLKNEIIEMATEVAESAGGFLRILSISKSEKNILSDIKTAFGAK